MRGPLDLVLCGVSWAALYFLIYDNSSLRFDIVSKLSWGRGRSPLIPLGGLMVGLRGSPQRINESPWPRCLQGAVDARRVVVVAVVCCVVLVGGPK